MDYCLEFKKEDDRRWWTTTLKEKTREAAVEEAIEYCKNKYKTFKVVARHVTYRTVYNSSEEERGEEN